MTRRVQRPPISALALLQQEMGEIVHRLSVLDRADRLPGSEWSPAVDVFEARDRLVVVIEVPGLAEDSLRVAFRERAILLEAPVDVAKARATLRGGLLTVTLPRLRERRGRETVVPIEREPTE